jgi:DNA-binding Xre family transcriptional regulator
MKEMNHNVKCNLRDLMWKNRIASINQLSIATKISRQTLHRLESGEAAGIQLSTLENLCDFFQCEITDLFEIKKEGK